MPENKKYLIQIDGLEGQSVRDAAWWDEKKDALYKKYPNAQVFELSSYDENDARDTDQYMIGIKGYEGTSMRDASWYHEKKDALDQKFGKDATVTRVRHVDYWRDKGIADEAAINATRGEIDELRSQQSSYKRWTPEYDAIEGQIAEKQTALIGLEDSYNKNPRVQEYNEMMQEAAEEYKRQLPKMLRERINNPERAYYTDAVPLDEGTVDTDAESGSKRPEIGPQKDNVSAAYGFEKTKKIAEDIRTGKVALPVNQRKLDAAESFLDAYDYLSENKSSVAQGMWYSIWESVGQEEFDEVHSVLSKLEDKYKNLNKISSEQIEETLTDAEKTLLEAYFLASEEEAKASGAFKGGEIAGESALIAGEMLLWSAATALTGGAAAPAGAASMTVSLGKGAINLSTKLLKGLGKWALKNSAKSLAFTALAPSTYKHIAQNKLQIGEDGRLKDETEDVLGYAAQEFIENFTEFSGDGLITGLKHLGKGAKYLGKAATDNKVGKAILGTTSAFGKKFTNAVSKIGGTPLKKLGRWVANPKGMEIMKNMGFHGLPAEILEEFEGAVLNEMTGLDNEAFEHFFDEDNFGTMLIGFAPMTLFGAGVSAASMAHVSRKMSKAEKNLRNSLLGTIKDAKLVDSVIEQAKAANTSTDIANALSGITRTGKVSVEQMKLLTDFGKSVAAYKATFSGDYKKFLEEVRKLNEPYNLGQNMTEADLYDVSNAESAAMQGVVDSGLFERTAEGTEEPLFSDDILNTTSTELVSLVHTRGNEMSDSEKSAINNLIASKSVSEGLQDKLNEEANKEISKNLNIANSAAVDGMLTTGQHDGKTVYIKGKLQVENGQIVRPSDMGSYPVEIVNATTGETTTVDSNEVSNVKQENAGDYKIKVQAFTTAIFNERWEAARNQMSTGAKLSEVNQMVGQKVYINTDNGGMALVEVNQILPNGDIMIKGKKTDLGGQSTKIVPVDTFYGMLKRDSDGAVIKDKTAEAYAGEEDFREGTHTILIDGIPVEVEVISQDDAANQIRYQYTDANGNAKVGSSTIDEFVSAIQPVETAPVASETPAAPDVPEAPVEEAPAEAPVSEPAAQPEELNKPEPVVELDAESINWDELFERDKEAYFAELQNQFGEETADILNEEIEAAQAELDALGKAKTKNQNERLQNRNKKKALQSRIDSLNGMVARLATPAEAAAETPVVEEVTETVDEAPAAQETEATVEVPAEEAPVTPEQPDAPVADTPAEPAAEPAAPVAPKKVADPVEAAKNREKRLLDLVERNGVKDAFKRDKAYEAGKDVGDFFATYEEYEDYQAEATDFGEYNNDFERGVKASFANRSQYHIEHGIERDPDISDEAIDLTNAVIDMSLAGANIDVERASDEQTQEVLALGGIENQFSVETDKPIFISNAALAVQGIKQEKATPEQWLKMIEKNGGLKAGEDKWIGLSDWLKTSDKRTLTKAEVLDFINENTIQIEEVNYSARAEENAQNTMMEIERRLNEKFHGYISEYYEAHDVDGIYGSEATDYAIEKLREEMGDTTFPYTIENEGNDAYVVFTYEEVDELQDWANRLGIPFTPETPSNETRLQYTSDGLENKREIAIIVPTIEPWNKHDDVHFGDAGDGRAVAWVRFGETEVIDETDESKEIANALRELTNDAKQKYGDKRSAWPDDVRAAYDMLIEGQLSSMRYSKVLVIDEIQSKRHQEGRDKGYSMSIEEYEQRLNALETERAERFKRRTILLKQLAEKYGDDFNSYLKLQDTAYVPNENVMTPEEVQEWYATTQDEIDSAIDNLKKEMRTGIPAAPFEKNWPELAMKRMLRYAAENGYDAIAWTKGEQQAERYSLAKSFSGIEREDRPDGEGGRRFTLYGGNVETIYVDESGVVTSSSISSELAGKQLSDVVGKDMASRMMALENNDIIDGENLKIGGEGMKGFYDKMLPAFMNKYGKKWGVKMGDIELPLVEAGEGHSFHSVPVNDAMRESVMEGQPMFFKTPNGIVYGWTDGKKIYLTKAGMNPNTKIHEYTHIWAKAMMQKNPKGWNSIKQLLKGTPIWNEVMNDANYSNIHNDEDAVASEALSRLSGSKNAAKMEQMAQKMIDEAKGTGQKLKVRGLIQNMKDALAKFWNWVGTNLFKIENFNSIDEITDRVLWDLVNKTDLGIADEITEKINEKANRKTFENKSLSSQNDGYTEEQTTDSGKLNEERRLYNPEGGKVSSESYSRFNPISKREGESDRQRDIRETRFLESFEKLTSDERILLYTFLSEYLPKNSGALKSRTDAFVQSIDNAEFAQFVEDFVNDELNYREGLASAAVAKHGLIVGVNQGLAAVERMFYAFNEDEYNGTLFDRAIKLAKRFGVSVKLATRNPDGSFFNAYGSYNPNDNSITLDASLLLKGNEQDLCKTIVHELLHSVVARAASIMSRRAVGTDGQFIDSQSLPKNVIDGINTLKEVYDAIKDDGTFQDTYGATSFEEMISEISDPKFRALLKAKSLWKKFLNGVCRILGIADESSEKSDALTEIESALDQIFASAENGELDTLYASYLGHLADGYTLEDLQQLSSGDVKTLLTQNVLFKTGIDPAETVRETARQVYDRVVNKRWQEFQRQFQDEFQPVRIAIDAIQQETGNIPIEDYDNYLLMQNHAASRSRIEVEDFKRRYYEPLIKSIDNIISTLIVSRGLQDTKENRAEIGREVRQYLIAKHGLERNMLYQETKGEMRDYAGLTSLFGLSDSDFEEAEMKAQEMIDSFENSLGRENDESGNMTAQSKAIEDLWKKINAATDKTLRHSYECGMLSRQQYDQIRSMFDFYIPLRGFDETTAEDVYAYARFEGNRFNPAVHTAKGRSSLADDPIATIMNMAESEIAQGNKNRAKLALYSYLLNRTRTDSQGNQVQNTLMQVESVWYVKSKDSDGNEVYTIAAPNHALGETYEQFEQRMQTLAANGDAIKSGKGKVDVGLRFQKKYNENEHYIYLKVNGEDKAIFINGDPKAANAINGRYPNKDHATFEKMRKVNRFLSSMFTNYSIEFTVRNIFRDAIYSRINIAMKEKDPKYRKKFRKNWWKNIFTVLGMLKKYRAGAYDNATLSEKERLFVEFMENGGQTGYTFINSVEAHKAELEKTLVSMRNGSKKGIKNTSKFKALLKGIEVLNESSELVTRFSAYETSRQMGRSILHSVKDAKEISVNFNTKGAQDGAGALGMIARWFGASKFFFNAAVQGVQNLKAMAQKGKGKFCGVACGMMASGVLMPVIQGTLASMLGYGDEEDYWNIPEYDRQNNICILVGGGDYIKIPLPIGFREMFGIGDMIMACACDRKFDGDIMNVSIDMANKIAAIALPINPFEGAANGLSLIESAATIVLPDAADFAFQWITNTDFKGAPIQKEYGYNKHDPEWTKAFANNPYWLTGFSKWCYELYPGLDWSPEKIDNTLSNLFGGMYTIAKKTTRVIEKAINDEDLKAKDFPVIGVFYGDGDSGKSRFLNSSYYEMKEYYDERIGEVNRVSKAFGYSLDEIFSGKRVGTHHPEVAKIYNSSYFDYDWMQQWYWGNYGRTKISHGAKNKTLGLDQTRRKINNLKNEISKNKNEQPTMEQQRELAKLQKQYDQMYETFVYEMLELD